MTNNKQTEMTDAKVKAITRQIRSYRDGFTADAVAYDLRLWAKTNRYDVLAVLEPMLQSGEVDRVSYTLYRNGGAQ